MMKNGEEQEENGGTRRRIPRTRGIGCGVLLFVMAAGILFLITIIRPPLPAAIPRLGYTVVMLTEVILFVVLGIGLVRGEVWAYWGLIGYFALALLLTLVVLTGVAVWHALDVSRATILAIYACLMQGLLLVAVGYFLRPRPVQS